MAAKNIRGITIEIDGNTTKLQDALRGVDKSLKDTNSKLRDVNKLLKFDPTNVTLLKQKHDLLKDAVSATEEKLKKEKQALVELKNADPSEENAEKQRALEREIAETSKSLKDYKKELNESNVALQVVGKSAEQVAEKTRALSAAAAAMGAALIGNAYKSAQAADDLNTLAKQTGFSVEELQKMQYASDLIDVSFDTMTGSIKKLTSQMSSGSEVFDTLGISIYDANGNMRDATDIWYESIEALSQIENETERDAISMELFGRSAMDMAGIVDDGGEALRAMGEEADELGIILDQDALQSANEFNDAIDRFKATARQSFMKAGATLAKVLTPALKKVADAANKVLTWFANLDERTQKIILTVLALVAAISPVALIISKITKVVGGLKTALGALSSAFTFLTSPVGLVIVAITALIAIGVLLYKNWDVIKAKAIELWTSVTTTFNNIKASISNTVQNISTSVRTTFDNIRSAVVGKVEAIRSAVTTTFNNIKYAITHPIETAKTTIANIVQKIKDLFNFHWEFPKIKLPHFRISGGQFPYGLFGSGSLPSIAIDWYAKAMRNGVIMNNPTIFGAANGRLLGAGEAGSETLVGTNNLMQMIQSAVGNAPVINMTVNAQGMNADELSSLVVDKITTTIKRNNQRW